MSEQTAEDRVDVEEVNLLIETTYYNDATEATGSIEVDPGVNPFILFEMKQRDGAIVLEVSASLIEGEEELIETLEVFFETMLEDRMRRGLMAAVEPVVVEDSIPEAWDA